MSNFWKRTITGSILVATLVAAILFNQHTYGVLFLIITVMSALELSKLFIQKGIAVPRILISFLAALVFIFNYLLQQGIGVPYIYLILPILSVFALELFANKENSLNNLVYTLFIPLYIALPFSFLSNIAFFNAVYSPVLLLGFFIFMWSNDTGAYLVGSSLGKHPLLKRISPKKTIEGFLGGVLLVQLVAAAIFYYTNTFRLVDWMAIGLIVSISGTIGDLIESMIKRNLEVKDSGSLFPGHGGFLDRFDGVLFAAPMVACYLYLVGNGFNFLFIR